MDKKELKETLVEVFEPFAKGIKDDFDVMNKRFDGVDKRLDTMQKDITVLKTDVGELKGRVNIMDRKLDAVVEQGDEHEVKIGELEKKTV